MELLNSWVIPNDTRQPEDRFDGLASERRWTRRDAELICELRDDLRHVVEDGGSGAVDNQTNWIDKLGMLPAIACGQITYCHNGSPAPCGSIANVRRYWDRRPCACA
jgi:hypothetical protein